MPTSKTPPAYYQTIAFDTSLQGRTIRVISKPGFPHWDRVSPASALFAEHVKLDAGARVLVLGGGHGALGVSLAQQATRGYVTLMDMNCVALAMAEQTLAANNVANARTHMDISVLPDQAQAFDTVVAEMPNDRMLARRWLVEALVALEPGGQLLLGGSNEGGIQSAIKDAQALFGNATVLGYKRRHRVARATKSSQTTPRPAWLDEGGIRPGTWHEWTAQVRGHSFDLRSLPGIFSYDRLDHGTSLLLDQLQVSPRLRVLDVGCGYGIIGLWAAQAGAAHVDMLDNNLLAVAATRENIARHGFSQAHAALSDGLSAVTDQRYDLVVSNPPFHVGKTTSYDVAHAFIEHARHVLKPGGQLVLVANKFIRYERVMRQFFDRVESLAETGKFHVLAAT